VFETANTIEAAFWVIVGLLFAACAIARRRAAGASAVAAVTFVLFGASDIVETTTGAWWKPWWLFCWKAACVLSMLILLAKYWRGDFRRAGQPSDCADGDDQEQAEPPSR